MILTKPREVEATRVDSMARLVLEKIAAGVGWLSMARFTLPILRPSSGVDVMPPSVITATAGDRYVPTGPVPPPIEATGVEPTGPKPAI